MLLQHFCSRNPHLGSHSRLTLFPQKFFLHGLVKSRATLCSLRRKEGTGRRGLRIVIHTVRDARKYLDYYCGYLHQPSLHTYVHCPFTVSADCYINFGWSWSRLVKKNVLKQSGPTAENLNRFWNSSSLADLLGALTLHPPTQHPVTLRPEHYIPWILRLKKVRTTWQFAPKVDGLFLHPKL
jgi:hypothetical protein